VSRRKPKTVALVHPTSGQQIEVPDGSDGVYRTQGWTDTAADEPTSED